MRCGKIIYPSAWQVQKEKTKAFNESKGETKLNYYYCNFCEGFHLTRMTKKAQTDFIKNFKFAIGNQLNSKELKK